MSRILNINVGVLGHVDSGKTALVAALSDILSTAALDKDPQSRERGMTLDLGLSCFQMPCPEPLRTAANADVLQFTLIDCPGHASLLRTILVGAHVMDIMVLVVDACRGVQAQTAECIVVGELLTSRLIVALNKVDLLPEERRMKHMRRAGRNVLQALELTRFAGTAVVPVAARIGGREGQHQGIEELKAALLQHMPFVARSVDDPFLFMADHCFQIKGQGTVLTGTVLQGQLSVGDVVELPSLMQQRKVKSIQCFKRGVERVHAGDRAGVCVTQLPAEKIERAYVSAPGLMRACSACVCTVELCRFYTGAVTSRRKVHVTLGHQTCMAQPIFFGLLDSESVSAPPQLFAHVGKYTADKDNTFDLHRDYLYQEHLYGFDGRPVADAAGDDTRRHHGRQWAVILFERPVLTLTGSVMISTKLDMLHESADPACRIAFYGNVVHTFAASDDHRALNLFRFKCKRGSVERTEPSGAVIIQGLFKKETDQSVFKGMQVQTSDGCTGVIEQPFGKAGKTKAHFKEGLPSKGSSVTLWFKKYVLHDTKKVKQ